MNTFISVNNNSFLSSHCTFFSCLIELVRISITILNRKLESKYLCLILRCQWKAFTIKKAVFSRSFIHTFIWLRKFLLFVFAQRISSMKCLFSIYSCDNIWWFYFINVLNYTDFQMLNLPALWQYSEFSHDILSFSYIPGFIIILFWISVFISESDL